ncbi:MAG: shikimate kinase [Bacteroidia bacterium]|nr:shikimate kinase [Bacteroidia bacterium]
MPPRIFLIGFMGAGKTTLGRAAAARLGWPFADLDEAIEAAAGSSIAGLFAGQGEAAFRQLERRTLESLASSLPEPSILSLGGGAPCYFPDTMSWLAAYGRTVYLRVSPQALAERLRPYKAARPLLRDVPDEQLPDFIDTLLQEREKAYLQAAVILQGDRLQPEDLIGVLEFEF